LLVSAAGFPITSADEPTLFRCSDRAGTICGGSDPSPYANFCSGPRPPRWVKPHIKTVVLICDIPGTLSEEHLFTLVTMTNSISRSKRRFSFALISIYASIFVASALVSMLPKALLPIAQFSTVSELSNNNPTLLLAFGIFNFGPAFVIAAMPLSIPWTASAFSLRLYWCSCFVVLSAVWLPLLGMYELDLGEDRNLLVTFVGSIALSSFFAIDLASNLLGKFRIDQ